LGKKRGGKSFPRKKKGKTIAELLGEDPRSACMREPLSLGGKKGRTAGGKKSSDRKQRATRKGKNVKKHREGVRRRVDRGAASIPRERGVENRKRRKPPPPTASEQKKQWAVGEEEK